MKKIIIRKRDGHYKKWQKINTTEILTKRKTSHPVSHSTAIFGPFVEDIIATNNTGAINNAMKRTYIRH